MNENSAAAPVRPNRLPALLCVCLSLLFAVSPSARGYSVLSHEEVVDLTWDQQIAPLLMAKYPQTTSDQLTKARAYAYGGCIIQDIGYYPFGSHFFSDLLHYVRTGVFVENLLRDASDVNEYAFALGAMAHYTADTFGHPAINHATAEEYPKLRDKFGNVVTYDDSPTAHLQTEFGFDVSEVANHRYLPQQYHDFIGFQVSKPVMERAFRDTYGFEVNQILTHEDLAIGSYRRSVSNLIPKMTRVALVDYGKQMSNAAPGFDRSKFVYRMKRADYEHEWGKEYQTPGTGSRILAFFLRLMPRFGPFRVLSLHVPSASSQKLFLDGMATTVQNYDGYIDDLKTDTPDVRHLDLPDRDLDTGKLTAEGEYRLTDETYAKLLHQIELHPQTAIPGLLRSSILDFYAAGRKNYVQSSPKAWANVQTDFALLMQAKVEELKVSDQPTPVQQAPVPLPAH
ncbi:MAG TPA: zinc dependent phospholipase C family protein [Acidisarcina sp.]